MATHAETHDQLVETQRMLAETRQKLLEAQNVITHQNQLLDLIDDETIERAQRIIARKRRTYGAA